MHSNQHLRGHGGWLDQYGQPQGRHHPAGGLGQRWCQDGGNQVHGDGCPHTDPQRTQLCT